VTPPPPLRHRSTRRLDAVLASHGLTDRVVELPESTRTAADAAHAVGCSVNQIVKSLLFRLEGSGTPVLVLAAGDHRVNEEWMRRYTGERLVRADPELVRSVTGFAIGGVPPVGHSSPLPTYIDFGLLELPEVWAAAGHPNAVCRLTSRELLAVTHGRPVPVVPSESSETGAAPWMTFDCYGTLVDWREGFFRTVAALGVPDSLPERSGLFHAYLEAEQSLEAGPYRPYHEIVTEALVTAARAQGIEITESQAQLVPRSIPSWPLFPDTRAGLSALRDQGVRLAILSNIDRDLLEGTLAAHQLSVDLVVTAEEVHAYKPALAHWIGFLKRTGAHPADVLHVAGSYEYDIESARSLGFRTAYVERYDPPPPGVDVGESIRDLSTLLSRRGPVGPPTVGGEP
jgi:2-haloalkanoic acid dehalogenase type II